MKKFSKKTIKEYDAKYADQGFDEYQKNIILTGIELGVDVSVYADHKYDGRQMEAICDGLNQGLDVSVYADPKFDAWQMSSLIYVLQFNKEVPNDPIDVSMVADLKFDGGQMFHVYSMLSYNKKFPDDPIDISMYADPKFNDDQMFEILQGHMQEIDITQYARPEIAAEEMCKIRETMTKGRKEKIDKIRKELDEICKKNEKNKMQRLALSVKYRLKALRYRLINAKLSNLL